MFISLLRSLWNCSLAVLTEDVDVLIGHSQLNVERFLRVVSSFGEGYASELTYEDFPLEPGAIRIIEESIGLAVDVFVLMKQHTLENFSDNILTFTSRNHIEIPYLDREALVYLKSGPAREKDLIDISALRKLEN